MTRKLEDIMSDVDRLMGHKWGISVEEAATLCAKIHSLEAKSKGLGNQIWNQQTEIDALKKTIQDLIPWLENYLKLLGEGVTRNVLEDLIEELTFER